MKHGNLNWFLIVVIRYFSCTFVLSGFTVPSDLQKQRVTLYTKVCVKFLRFLSKNFGYDSLLNWVRVDVQREYKETEECNSVHTICLL